jgi:hypothetical protein
LKASTRAIPVSTADTPNAPGSAPPTVGWISAVAAYGSFLVPAIFKLQVDAGAPQPSPGPS